PPDPSSFPTLRSSDLLWQVPTADHVDGSVLQPFDERFLIDFFAEGRHHLVVRIKSRHTAVVEQRLIGCDIARNLEFLFSGTDKRSEEHTSELQSRENL